MPPDRHHTPSTSPSQSEGERRALLPSRSEGRVGGVSDPTLHVRRDDLRPEVREYTDNLKEQILNILRAHHVRTSAEFAELVRKKKVTEAQAEAFAKLMHALAAAVRSNERPQDTEAHEIGRRLLEQAYQDAESIPDSAGTKSRVLAVVALEQHKAGENPDRAMRAAIQHLQNADIEATLDVVETTLTVGRFVDETLSAAEKILREKINKTSHNDLKRFAGYLAQNNDLDGMLRFVRWWGSNVVSGATPTTIRAGDLIGLMDIAVVMASRKQDPTPLFRTVEKDIEVHEQEHHEKRIELRKALVEAELTAGVDARKTIELFRKAWGQRRGEDSDYLYALYRARSGVLDGEVLKKIETPARRADILLSFAEHQLGADERISATETNAIRGLLSKMEESARGALAERLVALECRAGLDFQESLGLLDEDDEEHLMVAHHARLADVVAAAGGDAKKVLKHARNSLMFLGDAPYRCDVCLTLAEAAAKHQDKALIKILVDRVWNDLSQSGSGFGSWDWEIKGSLRAAAILAAIGESPRTFLDYAWEAAETESALDGLRNGESRVVKAEAQFGDLDYARELLDEIPNSGVTLGNHFSNQLFIAEAAATRGENPENDFDKARALLTPTNIQVWGIASTFVVSEARAGAALLRNTQNPSPLEKRG